MISLSLLQAIAPGGNAGLMQSLVAPLNEFMGQYGISTPRRQAMFLAMAADETDSFKTLVEYASGAAYEGRKDLGNVEPGDGPRYKGEGIFELTGRANYAKYSALTGLDLVGNPALARDPRNAVLIACLYWQQEGLNYWADQNDVKHVTYLINGGYNGLSDREVYYQRAVKAIPDFGYPPIPLPPIERPLDPEAPHQLPVPPPPVSAPDQPPVPSAPISPLPTVPWWQNWSIMGLLSSGVSGIVQLFTGAQGPLAWALVGIIVIGAGFGVYELVQYKRTGKW